MGKSRCTIDGCENTAHARRRQHSGDVVRMIRIYEEMRGTQ